MPAVPATPPLLIKRRVGSTVLVDDGQADRRIIGLRFNAVFEPAQWREFATGRAALDDCLSQPPDLMLLDLHLPDFNGLDVLQTLRQAGQTFPVIVLTGMPPQHLPRTLLELGVQGYLDKASPEARLEAAVNTVLDGGLFFSASRAPFTEAIPAEEHSRVHQLSPREKEIARLVINGFASKQIAARLDLSVRTVENHRARIMGRLGLVNAADLVRWCMRHGLS